VNISPFLEPYSQRPHIFGRGHSARLRRGKLTTEPIRTKYGNECNELRLFEQKVCMIVELNPSQIR
jgi:hypothetical protein